ncbi:MAG: aldehyde dehydrogenase family protein [Rhodobacteraceae bacterium]|nr:aldehyde dehydrogenase family protein [Paracoccaceae bacterium]
MDTRKFYSDGAWVEPKGTDTLDVTNPSTEMPVATISMANFEDADLAVNAARTAWKTWSQTPVAERLVLLRKLLDIYSERSEEMAEAISKEMGAPITFSRDLQVAFGYNHLKNTITALENFKFEHPLNEGSDDSHIMHESIGVATLITPWNWPMNQVMLKVAPALATGCTLILKPSQVAPLSSMLLADMVHQAGFPAGVFNLINGAGSSVGSYLCRHPEVDMVSFTGSTGAGASITRDTSEGIKRVSLELGGKGANIVFPDADKSSLRNSIERCFRNTGQSCNAPTRLLVERSMLDETIKLAVTAANEMAVGASDKEGSHIGPVASKAQYDKVRSLIEIGVKEGATLKAGGLERPDGLNQGWFIKPTVFANVTPDMTIAQEEIFGPVLSIMAFDSEEQAIALANDTEYGLSNYIQTADKERARRVARRLRSGMVEVNGKSFGPGFPFGGYKKSGNGREGGRFGLEEFLEVKVVSDWA